MISNLFVFLGSIVIPPVQVSSPAIPTAQFSTISSSGGESAAGLTLTPVSYTHLTLPTIYSV